MKKIKKYCRNRIKILDPRFLLVSTLVGILFCVSTAGFAQQTGRQYVTLDLKGVTLSVLFEEMMKQTDCSREECERGEYFREECSSG